MASHRGRYADTSSKRDNIKRLSKQTNLIGIATFVGLRALDPILQYGFLVEDKAAPLLRSLGGTTLSRAQISTAIGTVANLSPYRSILLSMSVASMLKQNLTLLILTQEETTVPFAFGIAGFNCAFNTVNSLLFLCAQTSPSKGEHLLQPHLAVGAVLFVLGMSIEVGSEFQRAVWKKKPENKGKVYTDGLFALSRHINFFGYMLWRTGYALAGGGWLWGGTIATFLGYDFTHRAIPALQHYLEEKYGQAYENYKQAVPYRFIPFLE